MVSKPERGMGVGSWGVEGRLAVEVGSGVLWFVIPACAGVTEGTQE